MEASTRTRVTWYWILLRDSMKIIARSAAVVSLMNKKKTFTSRCNHKRFSVSGQIIRCSNQSKARISSYRGNFVGSKALNDCKNEVATVLMKINLVLSMIFQIKTFYRKIRGRVSRAHLIRLMLPAVVWVAPLRIWIRNAKLRARKAENMTFLRILIAKIIFKNC